MYWSARTYSKYSIRVALPTVSSYVAAAAERGHPAIAITDRGSLGGVAELYRSAKKIGITPIPGVELPVIIDRNHPRPVMGRLTLLATSTIGYRNLAGLTRIAYASNKTGLVDFGDLASAAEGGMLDGVACLSGGPQDGMLTQLLLHSSPDTVRNVLAAFNGWFGNGLWIELCPVTGVDKDSASQAAALGHAMAASLGVGAVITTGPRYITPDDRHAWETLNQLNTNTVDHVPVTHPLHFADTDEVKSWYSAAHWNTALDGLAALEHICKPTIPELDTFTIAVPDVSAPKDPDKDLYDRANEALFQRAQDGRVPAKQQDAYYARLNEELEIVFEAGFSGYLLFTAAVTDWIRSRGILFNIRGSASASLLCWLLSITDIDPMQWQLAFDRFLSRDRAKPPDVDIDVDPSRRGEIVDWLAEAFPTLRIATFNAGKVSDTKPLTGSLVVQYNAMLRRTGQHADTELSADEEQRLVNLAAHEPYMAVGVGAAGFIVAPDETTINTIPVLRVDSSDTVVSAFDKNEAESIGYVKLDVLGVTTLTALRMIQESTGITEPASYSDKAVYASMATGKTGGLFQLEGRSSTTGMKRLKPKKFTDLVAAMALFRPALMTSGETDLYLARRARREPTPRRHPIIDKHVSETYGVMLYQEQAIALMRDLGLTAEEIEQTRKAIKASNSAVGDAEAQMKRLLARAMDYGQSQGMSVQDLAWLSEAMQAYANYGFNKAHAVSYARVSYLTAWYKVHYPLQFWVAFLTVYTGTDHEKSYLKEVRDAGIALRGAHVNKSGPAYAIDPDGTSIRKSLVSIKGIGVQAAEELAAHAPYTSLADLAARVNHRKITGAKSLAAGHTPQACGGVISTLHNAGALADLPLKEST